MLSPMTSIPLRVLLGSLLLGSMLACEPMTPSSNPFAPATVRPSVVVGAEEAAAPADPRFADFEEPQSISFEELQAMAPEALPPVEPEPPTDPEPSSPDAQAAHTSGTATPSAAAAPSVKGLSWAVRLVATVPNAQPPRAILGLPDGREIVVEPATMIPEVGLAVIAIGAGTVQLARFTANGDHATVESVQLTPQF